MPDTCCQNIPDAKNAELNMRFFKFSLHNIIISYYTNIQVLFFFQFRTKVDMNASNNTGQQINCFIYIYIY